MICGGGRGRCGQTKGEGLWDVFEKPLGAYYGFFFLFWDSSLCPEGERRWSFWKKPRPWWASQGEQW